MHLLHKTASQLLLNEVILFYKIYSPNQPLLEKTGKKKEYYFRLFLPFRFYFYINFSSNCSILHHLTFLFVLL